LWQAWRLQPKYDYEVFATAGILSNVRIVYRVNLKLTGRSEIGCKGQDREEHHLSRGEERGLLVSKAGFIIA